MGEDDDLTRRVDALEDQSRAARADAAAARALASGADRDVAEVRTELRAHTSVLNALRETQIEHGQKLDALDNKVDGHSRKLDEHGGKIDGLARTQADHSRILGEHSRALVTVQAGINHIVDLLTEREPPRG